MSEWTWRLLLKGWVTHRGSFTAVIVNGVRGPARGGPECHRLCADRSHLTYAWSPAPGAEHPTTPGRYSVAIAGPTGVERYVLADSLDGARAKLEAALVRRQRAWEAGRGS